MASPDYWPILLHIFILLRLGCLDALESSPPWPLSAPNPPQWGMGKPDATHSNFRVAFPFVSSPCLRPPLSQTAGVCRPCRCPVQFPFVSAYFAHWSCLLPVFVGCCGCVPMLSTPSSAPARRPKGSAKELPQPPQPPQACCSGR